MKMEMDVGLNLRTATACQLEGSLHPLKVIARSLQTETAGWGRAVHLDCVCGLDGGRCGDFAEPHGKALRHARHEQIRLAAA